MVHRVILSTASNKLFQCLEKNLNEKKFIIFHVKFAALKEFLRFVYTGNVQIFHGNVRDLLRIATKYDVWELRQKCFTWMIEHLRLGNVEKTIHFAEHYRSDYLLKACIRFCVL
jgi:hypothetical protein